LKEYPEVMVDISSINPNDSSLESYDPVKVNAMADSLKKEGQREAIVIDPSHKIIWKGHTRYLAAKKLGWKKVRAMIMTEKEWGEELFSGRVTP
jgi:ParB-like chromosome segregation protein Spo0J